MKFILNTRLKPHTRPRPYFLHQCDILITKLCSIFGISKESTLMIKFDLSQRHVQRFFTPYFNARCFGITLPNLSPSAINSFGIRSGEKRTF